MSTEQAGTDRLERDDSTPRGHRVPVTSYESDCRDAWQRVDRKLDRLIADQNHGDTKAAVIAEKVKQLEGWRDERMAATSQASMGVRFAIIGSIAGPLLMLGIHILSVHAKGSP